MSTNKDGYQELPLMQDDKKSPTEVSNKLKSIIDQNKNNIELVRRKDIMEIVLNGLQPHRGYVLVLQAYNAMGKGPMSPTITMKTSEGSELLQQGQIYLRIHPITQNPHFIIVAIRIEKIYLIYLRSGLANFHGTCDLNVFWH